MRERHETPLNPQQIEGIRDADKRQMGKHERQQHAMADHTLRVRCVEQAIQAIDALPTWPSLTMPQATTVTNNFHAMDVRIIAESIYEFVNKPLADIKGDE